MTEREALKLALEYVELVQDDRYNAEHIDREALVTAIKEALAQPEPWEKFCDSSCVWTDHHPDCKLAQTEPVAWMFQHEETGRMMFVEAQQLECGFEKGNPRLKKIGPLYTTKSQRTGVGLDWLPEHKCGLHLSHNEHRDVYETIEQFYDSEDFISPEEWHEALAKDSVWVLHWYPETPIGFIRIAASTLDAIEAKLKEKNT